MSRRSCRSRAILVLAALLSLASCGMPKATATVAPVAKPLTYVAIGGSDAVGVGSSDPLLDAWPQVFYRKTLPVSAIFINLAGPNSTVADALADQLPTALASSPNLVTIWLTSADLLTGVPAATYGAQLARLMASLRSRGATVLVANAPPGNQLPGYLACLSAAKLRWEQLLLPHLASRYDNARGGHQCVQHCDRFGRFGVRGGVGGPPYRNLSYPTKRRPVLSGRRRIRTLFRRKCTRCISIRVGSLSVGQRVALTSSRQGIRGPNRFGRPAEPANGILFAEPEGTKELPGGGCRRDR